LRCRRSQTGLAEISTTAELRRLKIPGYQLLERLGKGGMASVFCAIHSASGRKVAVKILPPASAQHPDLVLRFEREARLLATLDHPGVVQILDRGRIGSTYFFAMEYIEGHTLKERLEGRMLPLDEALRILICAGEAVTIATITALCIAISTGNIIITASGQ
jgi:serine/threonine-protein kinase